jgi:3',5'-cyclic AMP phosphodiesterase CpdA
MISVSRFFLILFFISSFSAQAFAFSFAVFGDVHANDTVYRKIISRINADKSIEFAVNTGDLVNRGEKNDYLKYLELNKSLRVPIYTAKGNHDAVYYGYRYFNKYIGESYYSFDRGNSHFIILDNALRRNFDSSQYNWLLSDLKADKKEHTFVFFHKPVFDGSGLYSDYIMESKRFGELIMGTFRRNKVDMVFTGHIHGYGKAEREGVVYIVTGGGGGTLHLPRFAGGFHHYVKVTVNGGKIIDEVVTVDD